MNTVNGYEGYILSITVLLVILLQLLRNNEKNFIQNRLFLSILITSLAVIIVEALSWVFDGMAGAWGYFIVMLLNTLQLFLSPFPLYFWILFLYYQIYEDREKVRRIGTLLFPLLIIFSLATLCNPFTGIFFYLDSGNYYHRGPMIGLALFFCCGLLIFGMLLILLTKNISSFRKKLPLLSFSIPPLIGMILQMTFYGLRILWGSIAISILIAYIYMQNRTIGTDYLTGLHNRRRLDAYLKNKIKSLQPGELLGAFFIDIDKFKMINDTYGHRVGDRAINATARLLRKISRSRDFIARYGGDEFVVLMDLKSEHDINRIVVRMHEQCRIFNKTNNELFDLKLSIGSAIYRPESDMTADSFLAYLDNLMYLDKNEGAMSSFK